MSRSMTNGEPWVVSSRLRDHVLSPLERKDQQLWKKVYFLVPLSSFFSFLSGCEYTSVYHSLDKETSAIINLLKEDGPLVLPNPIHFSMYKHICCITFGFQLKFTILIRRTVCKSCWIICPLRNILQCVNQLRCIHAVKYRYSSIDVGQRMHHSTQKMRDSEQ